MQVTFFSQKEARAGAAEVAWEDGVVEHQEGVELPVAGAAVGEVLEGTVDEGASEALVVVVEVVAVAEVSGEVVVVSEAHNIVPKA